MASNVQYNRLWQAEIAHDPLGYARLTALHDAVLERQALLEALAGDPGIEAGLRARADGLSRRIEEATGKARAPSFARVEHPSPHRWVVKVPLYTDIGGSG